MSCAFICFHAYLFPASADILQTLHHIGNRRVPQQQCFHLMSVNIFFRSWCLHFCHYILAVSNIPLMCYIGNKWVSWQQCIHLMNAKALPSSWLFRFPSFELYFTCAFVHTTWRLCACLHISTTVGQTEGRYYKNSLILIETTSPQLWYWQS